MDLEPSRPGPLPCGPPVWPAPQRRPPRLHSYIGPSQHDNPLLLLLLAERPIAPVPRPTSAEVNCSTLAGNHSNPAVPVFLAHDGETCVLTDLKAGLTHTRNTLQYARIFILIPMLEESLPVCFLLPCPGSWAKGKHAARVLFCSFFLSFLSPLKRLPAVMLHSFLPLRGPRVGKMGETGSVRWRF